MDKLIRCLPDFIALAGLYRLICFPKRKHNNSRQILLKKLMFIYLSTVLYLTLMPLLVSLPEIFDHSYTPMNLHPFDDLIHSRGDALRQILLNVLMTVPFGVLLPLLHPQGAPACLSKTFLLSLSIELLQPLLSSSRSSDITDIITNTLGGLLGYLLCLLLRRPLDILLHRL